MKLRIVYLVFVICMILVTSCKKDPAISPIIDGELDGDPKPDTVDFTCASFPKWFNPPPDSVTFPDKQAMYWSYVPFSKSKVVYSVNGYVWTYDFNTGSRVLITNRLTYLPQCNRQGWILYTDYRDLAIYKVKFNGDSLRKVTSEGLGGGRWDYSGNHIYYFSEKTNMLYKIDVRGNKLDSVYNVPLQFTAFSKISDKLYYGKIVNGNYKVVCLDMTTKQETFLITNIIGDFCIDNKDENIYCRTFDALIKLNIQSNNIDTLLKDCDSHITSAPYITANSDNIMTIGCAFTKFLDPKVDTAVKKPRLLRWTKTFTINVDDPKQQFKEVRLFP